MMRETPFRCLSERFFVDSVTRMVSVSHDPEGELLKNGCEKCFLRAFPRPNPDFFAARNFRLC